MKLTFIFLFLFTLHIVHCARVSSRVPRPRSFSAEVRVLVVEMARANGYKKFDKCHIVDWDFIAHMILRYKRGTLARRRIAQFYKRGTLTKRRMAQFYKHGKLARNQMTQFINDLAKIHRSASFFDALKSATTRKLVTLTVKYKAAAKKALATGNTQKLAKALFNIPSNLYPGDQRNNRSIKNRLDPPKAELVTGGRSDEATRIAKNLYAKYKRLGLAIYPDPSSPLTRAKSSDKPPGDTSGDYVTIV